MGLHQKRPSIATLPFALALVGCSTPEVEDTGGGPAIVDVGIDMVRIAPGSFTMGSPPSEQGRQQHEVQREVTLTRAFSLGLVEVTQGQFESFMGYNPSQFTSCGSDCPVEQVTWHEVAAFANAVSAEAGLSLCYSCTGSASSVECGLDSTWSSPYDCPGYRLPTEAEWEYAARAGTASAYSSGGDLPSDSFHDCEGGITLTNDSVLDDFAWYCGNSEHTPHPAGSLPSNPWGLHDMHGNIAEWSHDGVDFYDDNPVTDPHGPVPDDYRIVRGGSFGCFPGYARSANRDAYVVGEAVEYIGARLARSE